MVRRNWAELSSSSGAYGTIPALLIRMSLPPNVVTAGVMILSPDAGSDTSAVIAIADPASRFDLLDHTLRRVVILGIPRAVLVVFGTTDVIPDNRGAPARQQPDELTTEPSTGSGDHDNSSVEAQRFAVPWVLSH